MGGISPTESRPLSRGDIRKWISPAKKKDTQINLVPVLKKLSFYSSKKTFVIFLVQTIHTTCCSSIFVQDCATQCEIYDSNTLAEFNPIHMLDLTKQLKDLVNKKDKRTCEIFIEMEQMLQK